MDRGSERAAAKAQLKADRRTLLKGADRGASRGWLPWRRPRRGEAEAPRSMAGLCASSRRRVRHLRSVQFHAPEFQSSTEPCRGHRGAQCGPLRACAAVAKTGSGDFDILLWHTWMPDFVNLDMSSLAPLIDADMDDDLRPGTTSRRHQTQNSWAGHTYTYIVDNDNQTMFYRRYPGDPQGRRLQRRHRQDLPNPPQTLTDSSRVAKSFSPNGGAPRGVTPSPATGSSRACLRGQQSYWYSYP